MTKAQFEISRKLRANFMSEDYPIVFGILENQKVDGLPQSHKWLIADAFHRAWTHKQHKKGECKLFFFIYERGPYYKKFHYASFLEKVFSKFEALGFIKAIDRSKESYVIDIEKFMRRGQNK